jgi:LPXTG-site transpeptidase (sortase) family protein
MKLMSSTSMPAITHRRVNNALTILVIMLALYILAAPYLPQIGWWLNPPTVPSRSASVKASPKKPISAQNLLIIDRLDMRQTINSGKTMSELRKGPWLIPKTSTPDRSSNTVIAGHRFTYAGPAVFYFLDKVQLHDSIVIDWQHKEYTYRVATIKIVPPSDLSVQNPTKSSQLTLYTCTPLWTAKNRLIITAPLEGVRS